MPPLTGAFVGALEGLAVGLLVVITLLAVGNSVGLLVTKLGDFVG